MQKMSPIQTVSIALHIRAARIPINWTVRESYQPEVRDVGGRVLAKRGVERVFWPQVKQKAGIVQVTEIEDPLERRIQLFKIFNKNRTEKAALDFLRCVGAWRAVEDNNRESWAEGTYANVSYGHRQAIGLRVLPTTLDGMLRETERWYKLLGVDDPKRLEAEFKQPHPSDARPADHASFAREAHFSNTLPVSLEWHGTEPYAVIETLSVWELMIAAAWTDVVSQTEEQVCARCTTRFTWPRKKKYCLGDCAHLEAVKTYKRKKALEKQKRKAAKTKARKSLR
jgi:hypothetical protein